MRRFRAPVVAHALLGAVALLLAVAALAAEPVFPTLTGRIVDDAGILAPDARSRLDARLAEQERATGQQIVVVTLKSLQGYPIEDFGYRLGRRWGIGQKGRDNGALLIVAPNERKVRIEVGYGLEDRLTDAQSRIIIEQVILPQFRRGDFNAGVVDGTAAMLRVLGGAPLDGAAPRARNVANAPPPWVSLVFLLLVLGFFAASIAQQPKPKNYVLNVLNSGELDLHAPLRWHGILRDEPATLPWGTSHEIELANVAYQERSVSIQGGLRASYTPHDEQLAAPITAQVNSAKPKTPQDQQSNQQQ